MGKPNVVVRFYPLTPSDPVRATRLQEWKTADPGMTALRAFNSFNSLTSTSSSALSTSRALTFLDVAVFFAVAVFLYGVFIANVGMETRDGKLRSGDLENPPEAEGVCRNYRSQHASENATMRTITRGTRTCADQPACKR